MPPNPPTAVSIKERGNIAFKDGRMEEAAKLYRLAESKDANDRTYPSNLSAALYEIGDYKGCFEKICRATRLCSQTDVPFLLRLSTRLAKCLIQGVQNDTISDEAIMNEFEVIEQLKALASASGSIGPTNELQSTWKEWDLALYEFAGDRIERKISARLNLAGMDFKRQKLQHSSEFFHTGTDEIISMAHGWGSHEPIPLKISSYSDEQLSNLNFLIGGVGDGRHLLGTLIGLKSVHRSLSKRQKTVARFHLTALDIHPTAIARDLVFLFLLDQLVDGQTIAPETKAEVIATHMYAFSGVVMPDYCHKRLMTILDDLCDRLSEDPPRLPPWIFVPTTSIPPILDAIHYWIDMAKTNRTEKTLELHHYPNPSAPSPLAAGVPSPIFPNPDNMAAYSANMIREVCAAALENMPDQQLLQTGLVPAHVSTGRVRQYFTSHKSQIVETMVETMKETFPSADTDVEVKWYTLTKTIPIPKVLEARHTILRQLSDAVERSGDFPGELITKARREIETTWKPNITLHSIEDQLLAGAHKGYPVTNFNLPATIRCYRVFDPSTCSRKRELPKPTGSDNFRITYEWTSRMLSAAANTLVTLKSRVKVEIICTDLFSELQLMRNGEDHHRPKEFPRSFLRVWMSNIPDYTHGVINAITQVLPILQTENEEAAVALSCGLNTPTWANDEQFIYTYTFLRSEDVSRFLGCRLITKTPAFGVLSLGRLKTSYPLPLSKLATRKELTHWLSTQLINILVPGMIHYPGPNRIRFANNPVAFFRLLLYLHSIGYPSHWLSEFLQTVLRNDLTTEAVRAKDLPIPVSHATANVSARKVDLGPWVPELEVILVSAGAGLPFHIRLPENFATTDEEVGTYEADYRWSASSLTSIYTPFDHAAMLVFWRSSSIMYPKDVSQLIMGSIGERGRVTPRSDLVVVNCLEGLNDGKLRWKLAKKRVEKMKLEGDWVMAIFRSDCCVIVSGEVPSPQWREISSGTSVGTTPSREVI